MKITEAVLRPGAKRTTLSDSIAQWDYGQWIRITGVELPETFEVDFSLDQYKGYADPMIGINNLVQIPDALIEAGETIYAFVFLHQGEDDGETEYRITIPVDRRTARGTEAPDPVEQSVITQTIAAINLAAQKAEDEANAAEEAKQKILDMTVSAETVDADADATVTKTVDEETGEISLHFGIPRGLQGVKGDTGALYIPNVSTGGILNWTLSDEAVPAAGYDIVGAVLDALPLAEEERF